MNSVLSERMPESIKMALLQNAVKDIPQLSIVETLDEYTSTTSGAVSCTHLTYTSYYNLLINACVRYDATNTSTPLREGMYIQLLVPKISMILRNPTRHISVRSLTHHQMISTRCSKPNKANHHLHPNLSFGEITPESQLPLHQRNLSKNLMVLCMSLLKFISSSAQRLLLPSRNTILRPSTSLPRKRGIHVTYIADHESPPLEDTTHEEQTDPHPFDDAPTNEIDPILDYINSQDHQEEDMNHALQAYNVMASPTPDDTPHWSINLVHTHLFYHAAQAKQAQHGSLVDRGANGRLAGSDVRILSNLPGSALSLE